MNSEVIDKAFQDMICKRGIHQVLGIDRNNVYQLRSKLRRNIPISIDLKLRLLRRSGWRENELEFTKDDMRRLVEFTVKQSKTAKAFGAEYILEKWICRGRHHT
jgi:hypothetical protein